MTGAPDQPHDAGVRGLAWPVGAEQVRAMIAAGGIERAVPDSSLATRDLAAARDDLGAAEAILGIHPGPAFSAAYDAARKAATALLEHQGLRVKAGEGGHAKVVELVRAQLGPDQGRAFGAMRRLRNGLQYPGAESPGASQVDAEQAVAFAARLIEAVETFLPQMGVFR